MPGALQSDNMFKAGLTSKPDHIAQHLAQLCSELLQAWIMHILPGHLLQGFNYLQSSGKEVLFLQTGWSLDFQLLSFDTKIQHKNAEIPISLCAPTGLLIFVLQNDKLSRNFSFSLTARPLPNPSGVEFHIYAKNLF